MRYLRTRWHPAYGRLWRVGLRRREWWIGARYDFAGDAWVFCLLGLVLVVARDA